MTERSRRATQEGLGVSSPERRRALLGTPPHGATEVTPRPVPVDPPGGFAPRPAGEAGRVPTPPLASLEQATPTRIDTPVPAPPAVLAPVAGAAEQATPTELTARPERSEPIRVISMKDQAGAERRVIAEPRVPLHVQLRTMAEVAGVHDPAGSGRAGLGRLAPPHDPRQARLRRRRANLAWACIAVALAGGISLAIWLIAGR